MADGPRPELKVDTRKSTAVQANHVDRQTKPFGLKSLSADVFKSNRPPREGLSKFLVAAVSEPKLQQAMDEIRSLGGTVTSSGGIRDLKAPVDKDSRSATSFHYTGRAIDLYIYSGMIDPETDPYVVVNDGSDGIFEIFARTENPGTPESTRVANKMILLPPPKQKVPGKKLKLKCKIEQLIVKGRFFSVTEIFKKHGFQRIPAKPAFTSDPGGRLYEAAEWWHFQDEDGLVVGTTTFGELLRQVHTDKELEGTPPFAFKDKVWNGKAFD